MQTAFQRHNLITPFSLLKCNLTEMMDKLIATVDCAFQWFQFLIIARDNVAPVTFAIRTVHLIHDECVSNVLCFLKKMRFCEIFCVLICVDTSNYEGVVIVGRESDLCANNITRFKCVFCLILSNDLLIYQWNPIFVFSRFLNTRKTFYFLNKCVSIVLYFL